MSEVDLKREIQKICSNIAELYDKVDEFVGDREKSDQIIVQFGRSMGALCTAKMLLFGVDELDAPDKVCIEQYNKDIMQIVESVVEHKKISDIINDDEDDE